jgi:hypothetical protein
VLHVKKATLALCAAFAVPVLAGASTPALAATTTPAAAKALGELTLYSSPAGPVTTLHYDACWLTATTAGTYTAFVNQPAPGCLVTLTNLSGARYPLCAGRGTIPIAFQHRPNVIVSPGTSRPCTFATPQAA